MNALTRPEKWEKLFWPLLAAMMFLAVWHYSVALTGTRVFPAPLAVLEGMAELARKGLLWIYVGDSLRRVAIGFGAAAAMGVPLGLILGWYPAANQIVNPVLQMLRPISPLAWIPMAIVLFGVGEAAAVFLIFLSALFPIMIACIGGVANVPAIFRLAGRNFGLAPARLLAQVIFPAALPQIIIGLRIALGIAWVVVVAAEMIATDSGLGYLVIDARNSGKRYDLVVAAMLLIGVIGLILDLGVRSLRNIRSVRWGFRDQS